MQQVMTIIALSLTFMSQAQITTNFIYSNSQTAEELDTLEVIISNGYSEDIEVQVGDPYLAFGDTVFKPLASMLNIQAGSSETLEVACYSQHNMNHAYALPLVVEGYGTYGVQLYNSVSYSMGRYSGTQNKSGEALKTALKSAAQQGQNSLGYNTARDRMYAEIDNAGGDVTCAYTGRTATFNTRAGANANSFNCEHTFPQGFFNSNEPMKSDIFHLFPTDVNANSQRGNLPFGMVTNPSWSQGGSKKNSSRFEPRDVQKGKTARAMMYFVIRYQDYSNHFASQENILRTWNDDFPVSSSEAQRNNEIAQYQGNRNPFIDYPQFAERFTSFTSNGDFPSTSLAELSDDTLSLIQGSTGYAFFMNKGTEVITISGVQLSNSVGFAVDTVGDSDVQPGEGVLIEIDFLSTGASETGLLTLQTDDAAGTYTLHLEGENASGGEDNTLNEKISIYPNPSQDIIYATSGLSNVTIVDVRGVVVSHTKAKRSFWNVENLPAGLYYFNGISEEGTFKATTLVVR